MSGCPIVEEGRGGESAAERQRIEFKTSVLLICDLKMATFLHLCASKVGIPTIALEITCFWVPGRAQQFEQRTRESWEKWTRSSGCPLYEPATTATRVPRDCRTTSVRRAESCGGRSRVSAVDHHSIGDTSQAVEVLNEQQRGKSHERCGPCTGTARLQRLLS